MEISPGLQKCLELSPQLYDPNGTLYLSITEVGYGNACVRYETPEKLASWFAGSYRFEVDYGPGTEHAGTAKLAQHLRFLRGEIGPSGPVAGPGPGPESVGGWSFDADEVRARARNGVNQAGELIALSESLRRQDSYNTRGNPWASDGVEDDLVKTLYTNGTLTKIYPGEPPLMLAPVSHAEYVGVTLQGWLDEQKVVLQRGPSGAGGDPSFGPGVVA